MIVTINCVSRLQDNQDGGYAMYVYNDAEEMLADHPAARDGEMTADKREEILNGDDEYENGYIGKQKIELEVADGGPPPKIRLAKPLHFHAGQ